MEAGDTVLAATPESDRLHALDRATGRTLWTKRLTSGLLLAGSGEQGALVLESSGVSLWRMPTGELAWRAPLPEGESLAGEGVWLDEEYLAPLASGALLRVRLVQEGLESPRLERVRIDLDPLAPRPRIGTLAYHEGAVYSRSPTTLTRFDQLVQQDDAERLALARAEDALVRGEWSSVREALASVSPSKSGERLLAAACLLEAMAGDGSSEAAVAQIAPQVSGPAARRRVEALRIESLARRGELPAVVDAVVGLLPDAAAGVVVAAEPGREQSLAGWLADRVFLALRQAGEADFTEAAMRIEQGLLTGRCELEELIVAAEVFAGTRLSARIEELVHVRLIESGQADRARRRLEAIDEAVSQEASSNRGSEQWATRRVSARVATLPMEPALENTRRSTARRERRTLTAYAMRSGPKTESAPIAWRPRMIRGEARQLIGINQQGEPLRSILLAGMSDREAGVGGLGRPVDWSWRGLLVVNDELGVRAFDVTSGVSAERSELWSTASLSSRPPATMRLTPCAARNATAHAAEDRYAVERVVEVGSFGVVTLAGDTVICRDHETGRVRWRQSGLESVLRLIAQGDRLYVQIDSRGGAVLDANTGAVLDDWLPPASEHRLAVLDSSRSDWKALAGDHLLVADRTRRGGRLRVYSLSKQVSVWEEELSEVVFVSLGGDGELLLLDVENRLRLLDLASAEERFAVELTTADHREPLGLSVEPHGDRLLVAVNRVNPTTHRARGRLPVGDKPLLSGEVYCLDRETGRSLWPAPAELDGLGPISAAVQDCPLAFFASLTTANGEQTEASYALLAIDLMTGRSVFWNENLHAPSESLDWRVQREAYPSDRFMVTLGQTTVSLSLTDQPAPPAPPALARVEAPRHRDPSDLDGFGEDLTQLFRSFIEPAPQERQAVQPAEN